MMRMNRPPRPVISFAAKWIGRGVKWESVLGRTLGSHVRNTSVHAGEAHRTPSVFSPVQWP